jgi:multiple sugar transport system substrate-binding protein
LEALTMKKPRPIRYTALAVAAAVTLSLGACASGGQPESSPGDNAGDSPVEITYWDTQATPERTANLKELIAQFEKANPTITVNYVGLPSDSYGQKVDTAIATNSVPDVITTSITDAASWVGQGAMEPIDARFKAGGWEKKISPSMVKTARSVVPDHKLYFAPANGLANTLWINKGMLKKEGVEVPTSWNEFYAAAKTLTRPADNQFGYVFRGGAGMFPQLLDAMYGQSGVDGFFDSHGKSTLNDPANVKALTRYVSLYGNQTAKADLTNSYTDMVAEFDGGQGAMMNHNLGSYQDHVKALGVENVEGLQPFPSEAGPVTVSGATVLGPGIFKASKHKDAAWTFAEYFLSPKGNAFWAENSGKIPSNLEVAKQPWVQDAQPLKSAIDVLNNPKTQVLREPFYLPEYNTIAKTELEPEWQKVLQGKITVKAFLDEAAQKYTEAQAAYDKRNK